MTVSRPTAGHIELVLLNVSVDDAGNYTCTSRNTVGVDELIALLIVQCMSASLAYTTFLWSIISSVQSLCVLCLCY